MPAARHLHFLPRTGRRIRTALLVASMLLSAACLSGDGGEGEEAASVVAPTARFSQDRTQGEPGTAVEFLDESSGSITEREWDFGPLGTRSEANPIVTYTEAGIYSVTLTVRGPRGTSRMTREALIEIAAVPTAGFSCTPTQGFAPLQVVCTDASSDAAQLDWVFGDGASSTERNPTHEFTTAGTYHIEQTARSAGGQAQASQTVEVYPLEILASVAGGSAPLDVTFTAFVGSQSGFAAWTIDGESQLGNPVTHRFASPGRFTVQLAFGDLGAPFSGMKTIEYVVDYGPAVAAFEPSVRAGPGPLSVTFEDRSGGALDSWHWQFGDGTECIFPAPEEPDADDPIDVCDAQSPTHEYASVGSYDVALAVSGPGPNEGDPLRTSQASLEDAVRVTLLDPSFEAQVSNAPIAGGWTSLRPEEATVAADHLALSRAGGADAGMPTDGSKWAVLDGLGTDGRSDVDLIENGIRQTIMPPADRSVLEFDYVLLYAEPPAALARDAVTATISDGVTTIEIESARADTTAAYAGVSTRFPTRDGSVVRTTPVWTASVDLAAAFSGASGPAFYTLTIRTTNALNALRSPRVYVDHVRFVEPAASAVETAFSIEALPVVAGFPTVFLDETCLDPVATGCQEATSWRWDFDTATLASPPTSAASDEQNPTYTFPVAGLYEVTLQSRSADQQGTASLWVEVLEGPVADFVIETAEPYLAPATLVFSDRSTADPGDAIVSWSWDFGGWGSSTEQDPPPVTIGQAGEWIVRLTVSTASGRTREAEMTVLVE